MQGVGKNNYLNDKDVQEKYLSDLKISESSLTQELKINKNILIKDSLESDKSHFY